MKHRILSLYLLLMLTFTLSLAEAPAPTVNDMGLELMGSAVHYPQLTGLDPAVQTAVNAAIMEKGHINDRLSRMAALLSAPVKLNVSYTYTLQGNVFSCAILADGAVETSRATQVWSAVNYDLSTGQEITFADLFTDVNKATSFIETYLNEQVVPELSAHLPAGTLTPIPEVFTVSSTGLTLYYDIGAFRTLSDKAGTVTILWSEFPADMVTLPLAQAHLSFPADTPAVITDALKDGSFTGIPAAIGQPMQELIDRYKLLTDPDIYEGGRMIALEDGAFRNVWLLTDALTEEFDQSTVQGIRADRLNFYGLCTGDTTIDWWREVLGEPGNTLTVDENRAESWRIVPGTSDYYTFGDYRLRLHADESGVLRSVFLTR
ncbi:MAG: hypothetical protein IJO39_06345 [Clostridia bacterium]|nr:hypothetical protein [Clostridia bacterium]